MTSQLQNSHTFVARMPAFAGVCAVFLGAFLLFFIQPLWGRHLVMVFGGGAMVWNVLLFAFQALLFAGYLVVFVLQFLKFQKIVWWVLMAFAAIQLCLPLPEIQTSLNPSFWDLMKLFLPLLFPVLLLSVTTPYVQKALATAKSSGNYSLYSLSNAGSFLALVILPFFLLPLMPLAQLLWGWKIGVFVFLFLLSVLQILSQNTEAEPPVLRLKKSAWLWFLWPFLSTGVLHAYSQFLNNEIANLPLVWVLPLGLYLLSYVVAFAGVLKMSALKTLAAIMFAAAMAVAFFHGDKNWLVFGAHMVAYGAACLLAHGLLFAARPTAAELKAQMPLYYMLIGFGGMCAGLINAQVYPYVLAETYEYPAYYLAIAALAVAAFGVCRKLVWAGAIVLALVFSFLWVRAFEVPNTLASWRNFYGVMKVVKEGDLHVYYNNGTAHEFQDFVGNTHAPSPYLMNLISASAYKGGNVAVIGMGPGNTACYTTPDQTVDFYEINPLMPEMAEDTNLFTYRRDCARQGKVVFGDGRIAFPNSLPANEKYDVIVNTAHNGFTLPLHLVTKEAFAKYGKLMKPDGVLMMIVPVRYIDHKNALVTTAEAAGFKAEYVPNSVFRSSENYPYSWYAFYKTDNAKVIIEQAMPGVWRKIWQLNGRCATLTDEQHSFLQIAGLWGPTCQ